MTFLFTIQKFRFYLLTLLLAASIFSKAQTVAKDEVKDEESLEEVEFSLFSAFGHCDITATSSNSASLIYGDYDDDRIGYEIKHQTLNHTQKVELDIKGKKPSTFALFTSSEKAHSDWNIYLSRKKNLNLNLEFGHGDADIILSGMHLKKLHLLNSSADVDLDYRLGQANVSSMDSIVLEVKSGHLHFGHLEMAKAKVIDVSVDFGTVELDFEKRVIGKTEINAHVSGGKIIVHLPKGDVPVLIKYNHAEFSKIHVPKDYSRTKEGYYKSSCYKSDAKSPIIFNFDLTIGSTIDLAVLE